jgi:hypothetical protein
MPVSELQFPTKDSPLCEGARPQGGPETLNEIGFWTRKVTRKVASARRKAFVQRAEGRLQNGEERDAGVWKVDKVAVAKPAGFAKQQARCSFVYAHEDYRQAIERLDQKYGENWPPDWAVDFMNNWRNELLRRFGSDIKDSIKAIPNTCIQGHPTPFPRRL